MHILDAMAAQVHLTRTTMTIQVILQAFNALPKHQRDTIEAEAKRADRLADPYTPEGATARGLDHYRMNMLIQNNRLDELNPLERKWANRQWDDSVDKVEDEEGDLYEEGD
jgi:hypothetical protein